MSIGHPLIHLDGAALTYPGPPPVEALHATTLTIDRGEYAAVVGPSGSGKSTLLNVLGLLDRPTGGRYEIDGEDTVTMPERRRTAMRADRIGFVFQSFHLLFHRTALDNVAMALLYQGVGPKRRRTVAARALSQVGLGHRCGAVPSQLSGGERQRVAVARALAASPSLLLCDEPTGNLDTENAEALLDTIDGLRADGLTVVMITHDATVAARADRTLTIRDGMVRADRDDGGARG